MMKKTLFSLVALSAIFAGCSSDKSSDPLSNDLTGESPLEHPQNAEAVEDELDENSEGCSVGLDMTADVDPEDSRTIVLNIVGEKSCAPDHEVQPIADIYGDLTYSLRTRSGEVVVESLPVGSVHYGCIDLTDVSSPKLKVDDCTGIAPGTYRLYITYEGTHAFYSFKVRGETDELEEHSDECSVGLDMATVVDPEDSRAVILNISGEKSCAPDYEAQPIADIYGDLTYSIRTRSGEVVAESLPVGSVHYGCIDLTDASSPKFKVSDCTGIAPGTYRLYITYEGTHAFYSFMVRGEIEE